MNHVDGFHDADIAPLHGVNGWRSEEDAAADFDRRIELCIEKGIFARSFREVRGYYLTHRPLREDKQAFIDRILLPGPALISAGWTRTIGVELKKSDCNVGRAISQAIDYTYCTFNVGNYWMYCERIFLWPFVMPRGPLQSVMLQNGVGTVFGRRYPDRDGWKTPDLLTFQLEKNNIVVDSVGSLAVGSDTNGGRKKGSR